MKRNIILFAFVFTVFSLTFLIARSYRVDQVPHGSIVGCNTCHTNGGGTQRNSFGLAVQLITGSENVNFWGPSLASLDSDGDGFTNGEELQDPNGEWIPGNPLPGDVSAVTHPGDPNSFPPVTSVDIITELPNKFELKNNYPNPFNPTTTISFNLPQNSYVRLEIFNAVGELIRTLVDQNYGPGNYSSIWNARDDFGYKVNSGIYLYRIVTQNFVETKRMVLMK